MITKLKFIKSILFVKSLINENEFKRSKNLRLTELRKKPSRTFIINYLLKLTDAENYLEIGVRNTQDNFNHILCKNKFSVDPGFEFKDNSVTFKLTSDDFFNNLFSGSLYLDKNIKFDCIFLDGLHTSYQLEKDIKNAIQCIKPNGYIVLHDCNPPTEYHARENYNYKTGPALKSWNGTSWKAFYKFRHDPELFSCCIDSDWGVGIISRRNLNDRLNRLEYLENYFYEFSVFEKNKVQHLNLISWSKLINQPER